MEADGQVARAATPQGLAIVDFTDDLADDFYRLNAEWIRSMFRMEASDEEVLRRPRRHIIDRGGEVLFIRTPEGEVIGTGAIQPVGDAGDHELTKMAVSPAHRGGGVGEVLLVALLQRARDRQVPRLHLLTNSACASAIHLYEKHGFHHDAEVMRSFGAKYARADVAMRYPM